MTFALKLYAGDETQTRSPVLTLAEVWEQTIRSRLAQQRRAESTLKDYDRAVRSWVAVMGDPPLDRIHEQVLDDYTAGLGEQYAARTINKYTTYLQSILDACGPDRNTRRSSRGRNLGLLEHVPKFQLTEEDEPTVRACPSIADIAALDQSTHVAQHPPRQSAIKWRAALRLLDWCGVRRNDLFLNLRLSNWIPGERCPVDTVELYWPWGWLSFVPEKTKRTKKRPHVVPLSPELASLFRQIIRPAGESDPPLLGFLDSTHQWYRELYRIQEQAGLAKRYGFHAFRKRCNVTWDELCGMGTGGLFLCHAAKGVNARSYSEAASLMVQAAEKRIEKAKGEGHASF